MYHLPLGTFMLRRGDVYHGDYGGSKDNFRLHLGISIDNPSTLLHYAEYKSKKYFKDLSFDKKNMMQQKRLMYVGMINMLR